MSVFEDGWLLMWVHVLWTGVLDHIYVSVCQFLAQVIYLTSLQEMTLVDMNNRGVASKLQIESEPSFCGLGPNHAAVGMNNQVSPVCLCVYI